MSRQFTDPVIADMSAERVDDFIDAMTASRLGDSDEDDDDVSTRPRENLFSATPRFLSVSTPTKRHRQTSPCKGTKPGRSLTRAATVVDEDGRESLSLRPYTLPTRAETRQLPTDPPQSAFGVAPAPRFGADLIRSMRSAGGEGYTGGEGGAGEFGMSDSYRAITGVDGSGGGELPLVGSRPSTTLPGTSALARSQASQSARLTQSIRGSRQRRRQQKAGVARLQGGDAMPSLSARSTRTTFKHMNHTGIGSIGDRAAKPRQPRIDEPHRVYPPPFMSTPVRYPPPASAAAAAAAAASAAASSSSSSSNSSSSASRPTTSHAAAADGEFRPAPQRSRALIQDYMLRAVACRRAGRRRAEANSYFCLGVMYDNMCQYHKAIDCYEQFRQILSSSADRFASALAHNCIAISYYYLGRAYYPRAIYHHAQHRDTADIPGQFIAYTNLGLVYNRLGNNSIAVVNHQHALRCAIRMNSMAAQSIAIGNLGLTGFALKDYVTAKACMLRHIKLNHGCGLGGAEGLASALQVLGEISIASGDHRGAQSFFNRAACTGRMVGQATATDSVRVHLGISVGNARFEEHMRAMSERFPSNNSPRKGITAAAAPASPSTLDVDDGGLLEEEESR